MNTFSALALAILTIATSSPASAVIYLGQFNGVVTRGQYSVDALFNCGGCQRYVDLSNRAVSLSFRTEITDGQDPLDFPNGQLIATSVVVAIDGGYDIYSSASNSPFASSWDRATYRGNARTAVVSTFNMPNNYYYSANFQFGLPSGGNPFFGFGSAVADQTGWSGSLMILTSVAFRLTSGTVVTAGMPVRAVPEPQVWALMTIGIGFVGAFARRGRRTPTQIARA